MMVETVLDSMSGREFAEWCYFLSDDQPAVQEFDVEEQLRKVFGRPKGSRPNLSK